MKVKAEGKGQKAEKEKLQAIHLCAELRVADLCLLPSTLSKTY